jgi:hypothetical protein
MLLRRVVKNLQLERDPEFRLPAEQTGSLRQRLSSFFGSGTQSQSLKGQPPLTATSNQAATSDAAGDSARGAGMSSEEMAEAVRVEPYVEAIQASLKVEPVKEVRLPIKETRLINVSFSHQNPQTAARVVNAIAEAFINLNLERKTEMSTTTGDILQGRISDSRAGNTASRLRQEPPDSLTRREPEHGRRASRRHQPATARSRERAQGGGGRLPVGARARRGGGSGRRLCEGHLGNRNQARAVAAATRAAPRRDDRRVAGS